MKSAQIIGFLLAIGAGIFTCWLFAPIDAEAPAYIKGAAGMGFIGIALPTFAFSALLLIPTTAALFFTKTRYATNFKGPYWLMLWVTNIAISCLYLYIFFLVIYTWVEFKIGA